MNLRLSDIDMARQRLFVRLPTKNDDEGWVPFHELTKKYLSEWLELRPSSKLDYVFVGERGRKLGEDRLRTEFKRILCHANEPDAPRLAKFSYHRFRHSMASHLANGGADVPTVTAVGRWRSASAAQGYIDMADKTVRNEYLRAMDRKSAESRTRKIKRIPFAEFARSRQPGSSSSER
jgi:integrase/recombinase XerC